MTFGEYLKNLNINYNDNPDNPQGNQVSGDQSHKLPVFDTENLDNLDYNKLPALQKNSILDQEPSESTQETHLGTTSTNSERVEQEASPTEEMSTFEKVLNAFLSFGKIREKVEKECNGDVADYLKEVAARDGNANDLTIDDFEKELKEEGVDINEAIQNATGSSAATETNVPEEVAEVATTEPETSNIQETVQSVDTPIIQSPPTPSRSNRPRGYGMTGSKRIQPNPLWTMSLDELKAEKETRTNTLKEKQQAVNDIHSGKNEKVKAAKENLDTARAEYEKAVENDPKMKSYKDEITRYLEEEKTLSTESSENEIAINNITVEISKQDSKIFDLEASVKSLESQLSSLAKPTGKPEDKAKDDKLKEQRNNLETKIKDSKKELNEAKENLEKSNKTLESLKKEKEKIQTAIKTNKENLANAEKLVKQYASKETKAKLNAYNKATQELEKVKEQELATAVNALDEAQKAVMEVNDIISVVQNRDPKSTVEQAIKIAYEELKKGVHEETGHNDGADVRRYTRGHHYAWCAAFVSYCYGDGQHRNNKDTFGYDPGVNTIRNKAIRAGYYTKDANYTPKRGDLIMYPGHTGLVAEVNKDGSYVTIEGNTSNAVRMKQHKPNSGKVGFVRMSDWLERA